MYIITISYLEQPAKLPLISNLRSITHLVCVYAQAFSLTIVFGFHHKEQS